MNVIQINTHELATRSLALTAVIREALNNSLRTLRDSTPNYCTLHAHLAQTLCVANLAMANIQAMVMAAAEEQPTTDQETQARQQLTMAAAAANQAATLDPAMRALQLEQAELLAKIGETEQ